MLMPRETILLINKLGDNDLHVLRQTSYQLFASCTVNSIQPLNDLACICIFGNSPPDKTPVRSVAIWQDKLKSFVVLLRVSSALSRGVRTIEGYPIQNSRAVANPSSLLFHKPEGFIKVQAKHRMPAHATFSVFNRLFSHKA